MSFHFPRSLTLLVNVYRRHLLRNDDGAPNTSPRRGSGPKVSLYFLFFFSSVVYRMHEVPANRLGLFFDFHPMFLRVPPFSPVLPNFSLPLLSRINHHCRSVTDSTFSCRAPSLKKRVKFMEIFLLLVSPPASPSPSFFSHATLRRGMPGAKCCPLHAQQSIRAVFFSSCMYLPPLFFRGLESTLLTSSLTGSRYALPAAALFVLTLCQLFSSFVLI